MQAVHGIVGEQQFHIHRTLFALYDRYARHKQRIQWQQINAIVTYKKKIAHKLSVLL